MASQPGPARAVEIVSSLRALEGALSLEIHATRIRVALVDAALAALLPREPSLVRRPIEGLPLVATYRIDGRPDSCLTDDHLMAQGIDGRDLHGIALAVLRRRFDAAVVERLARAEVPQVITSDDGTATSAILVLPDFLARVGAVGARLDGPDRLEIRPLPTGAGRPTTVDEGVLRIRIDPLGHRIL